MSDERWQVQFSDGEVREFTLEELDDAFHLQLIDEHTFVRENENAPWAPLGEVAGLEDPIHPPELAPAVVGNPADVKSSEMDSLAPGVVELSPVPVEESDEPNFRPKGHARLVGSGLGLFAGVGVVFLVLQSLPNSGSDASSLAALPSPVPAAPVVTPEPLPPSVAKQGKSPEPDTEGKTHETDAGVPASDPEQDTAVKQEGSRIAQGLTGKKTAASRKFRRVRTRKKQGTTDPSEPFSGTSYDPLGGLPLPGN